jgi:hypothetical protein
LEKSFPSGKLLLPLEKYKNVHISYTPDRTFLSRKVQNGGSVKHGCLSQHRFLSLEDAQQTLDWWKKDY